MVLRERRRQRTGMGRHHSTIARLAVAIALLSGVVVLPAAAQGTLNEAVASRVQGGGPSRLLVEAKELVYDNDNNKVILSGDVELSYQGRTLQADRVVYDRNTGRVLAEGNARLTEANGSAITGERFELSDDFKNGFIDALRVEQTIQYRGSPVKTRFSAPRAERIEGDTIVLERGTYTACEPCKDNPEKPPLWQVKAARIIHNNEERTIYYENATLELAGVPIAYVPYFWSPDPTVKRKTGFLGPSFITSTTLGTGVAVPFFWAIAPNYDLTVQPTILSRQGLFGQAEWRHRLLTGAYNIRAAGIFELDKSAFLPAPFGPREQEFRGSIESTGRFAINERWRYGWDVALLSDRWFLQHYNVRSESLATNILKESISTAYLQGQGDRSWFDVRGYYFRGLSSFDYQPWLPVVHPVLDYNKRIDGPTPIGGEVGIDVNLTSLTRETAHFQPIKSAADFLFPGTPSFGLYETCSVFERGKCLVRGLSGTFTRLSTQLSWRRNYIDSVGQVWTPFAYARVDGFWNQPNAVGYQNEQISNFIGTESNFVGRAMPAVGLEYRYPFVADAGAFGTHTVSPIAQVIARPNETRIGQLPNEDAQSLVFDDTSLFQWDKFSGYDRVEGGVRANLAAQYSVTAPGGFYGDALFGQSVQLAGLNSFQPGDIANVGRDSGLESRLSDYVARVHVQPTQNLSVTTRGRFDQQDFSLKRFEVTGTANLNPIMPLSLSLLYARYEAQPELGYDKAREGVAATALYNITPRWFLNGSAAIDLDKYFQVKDSYSGLLSALLASGTGSGTTTSAVEKFSSLLIGVGYKDECTTFAISYGFSPQDVANGLSQQSHQVLVRLELRTLGELNFRPNFGTASGQDGIASAQ